MARLYNTGISTLLAMVIVLVVCGLAGCQKASAPAEVNGDQSNSTLLDNEPKALSQDLTAEQSRLLRKHFPDYTLPLSETTAPQEPSETTVDQPKQELKIEGKPLATAICQGDIVAARRLIESGNEVGSLYDGYNMLHLAARRRQPDMCSLLLDAGMDIHQKDDREYSTPRTPLQFAIQSGSVETAKLLLARGAKLTPADRSRDSKKPDVPLTSLAITSGNPDMLSFLIDQGEAANDGQLLLKAIAGTRDPDRRRKFVEQLLAEGAPLDGVHDPFVSAVGTGDIQLLSLLEVRRPVKFDDAHLRAAVESGNINMCRYVVSKGATTQPNPPVSRELMRLALVRYRSPELVELVAEAGEKKKYCVQSEACTSYCSREDFAHPLYHAVMANDLDFCRYLIREFSSDKNLWGSLEYEPYEYESDIEFFQKGNTIFFAAVYEDNADALKLLLKYTQQSETVNQSIVDIDAGNWSGSTVLHEAVNFGAAKCVQLLLAAGADASIARNDGYTPLHIALRHHLMPHKHSHDRMDEAVSRIFPMLLAANLAQDEEDWVHRTNANGETILHQHARAGYPAVCRKLIELGADVNAIDKRGRTPLHQAFDGVHPWRSEADKQTHVETCTILLDNGTDLNQVDAPAYLSYLRHAADKGLYDVFDTLLEKGADKNLTQDAGHLFCSAAAHGNQKRIKQLLEWGADINAQGYENSTALHQAARRKDVEMCRLLIARGADVDARDERGQTPLFEVFDRWAIHMGKYLAGNTAETQGKAFEVLQLLLSHGADPDAKADSTTSTSFSGTVLQIFKNMPKDFRDALEKSR